MRIELIGLLGSGKTTLAKALGKRGWRPLLEDYQANPFWRPAAVGASDWFPADLVFLLQHRGLLLGEHPATPCVCDFSLDLDCFYAMGRNSAQQQTLYRALHEHVIKEVGYPDLAVFLDASPEYLCSNITERKRPEESQLSVAKLQPMVDRLRAMVTANESILRIELDRRISTETIADIVFGAIGFRGSDES